MAMTVVDVLERRTHISWEDRDNGITAAPRTAEMMGGVLGWDSARQSRELLRTKSMWPWRGNSDDAGGIPSSTARAGQPASLALHPLEF